MTQPGVVGWLLVGAVVVGCDAVAIRRHQPTLSAMFWKWREWSFPVLAGVVVHLVWREAES